MLLNVHQQASLSPYLTVINTRKVLDRTYCKQVQIPGGGVFVKHLAPGIELITHTETIVRDPSWAEVARSTLVTSLKPLASAQGVKGLRSLSPVGTHPNSHGTLLCLHDVTLPTSEALICRQLGPTWLLESGCPEIPAQGKGLRRPSCEGHDHSVKDAEDQCVPHTWSPLTFSFFLQRRPRVTWNGWLPGNAGTQRKTRVPRSQRRSWILWSAWSEGPARRARC